MQCLLSGHHQAHKHGKTQKGHQRYKCPIRALRSSGYFDDYGEFHKRQEFWRNHVSKFQEPERLLAI
ncbi:MAG: hypothetical protein AB4372_25440 [Xenococcus sp. (in: cyanobacteria)]